MWPKLSLVILTKTGALIIHNANPTTAINDTTNTNTALDGIGTDATPKEETAPQHLRV